MKIQPEIGPRLCADNAALVATMDELSSKTTLESFTVCAESLMPLRRDAMVSCKILFLRFINRI